MRAEEILDRADRTACPVLCIARLGRALSTGLPQPLRKSTGGWGCEMFADTGGTVPCELKQSVPHRLDEFTGGRCGLPEARAWIYTTGQVTSIPFKPKNPQAEMRLKAMACAFIFASRKAGIFEGAVTVAEAWMAMGRTRQPLLPPSQDPDRIEVVIFLAYGDDGRAAGRARRIITHDGRPRLGEPVSCFQQTGMHYESWLDDAFKGYTTH